MLVYEEYLNTDVSIYTSYIVIFTFATQISGQGFHLESVAQRCSVKEGAIKNFTKFSKFCKIFKNTHLEEHRRTAASFYQILPPKESSMYVRIL